MSEEPKNCDLNCNNYIGAMIDCEYFEKKAKSLQARNEVLAEALEEVLKLERDKYDDNEWLEAMYNAKRIAKKALAQHRQEEGKDE